MIVFNTQITDLLNICIGNFIIFWKLNALKINVKFPIFNVINTCENGCFCLQVKQSGSSGTIERLVEKGDRRSIVCVVLIQADDEYTVFIEGLRVYRKLFKAVDMVKVVPVSLSDFNKKSITEGVTLLLINQTGWPVSFTEPGEIGFKPTPMVGG